MRSSGRLDGLDAARGLAVVAMLVAGLAPAGWVLGFAEYLTAPLFAVIVGVSMGLHLHERQPAVGWFLLQNLERGLLLVVLGVLLQQVYAPLVVTLPHVGLLVLVLAPLAVLLHRAPVLTVGVAAAGAVLGQIIRERVQAAIDADATGEVTGWVGHLLDWLVLGESCRVSSLLPMALAGLALATVLRRATEPPEAYAVAGVLFVAAAAARLLGGGSAEGSVPSSGSTASVVGGTFLAAGVVVASFLLLHRSRRAGVGWLLAPVVATGRLALTAYTTHIMVLALVGVLRGGADDDSWVLLFATTAVVLGSCWVLERRWGTGPLEWVVHRLRPTPPHVGRHVRSRVG